MNKDLDLSSRLGNSNQGTIRGPGLGNKKAGGDANLLALDARNSSIININPELKKKGKDQTENQQKFQQRNQIQSRGSAPGEPPSAVRPTSSLASQSQINNQMDNQSAFNISQNPITNRSHISGKSVTQKSQISQRTNITQRSQISQNAGKMGSQAASKTGSKHGRFGQKDQAPTADTHTDVYSWGADHSGQLGLGLYETGVVDETIPCSLSNNVQPIPRYCTYGIIIRELACGMEHSAFITADNFLYTMGSNRCGQLGIGDPNISYKNSPVLVEKLADQQDASIWVGMAGVSCGSYHTIAHTKGGDAWSWGEARFGALGATGLQSNQFTPVRVEFKRQTSDSVSIMQVTAGSRHSMFLDVYGRVYATGDNEFGQLGYSARPTEATPSIIPNFNDVAQMISGGYKHSLILTRSGLVYSFGSNDEGQLGVPSKRSSSVPVCIQDISHVPMKFIAAGSFSASISQETNQLYLWGTGTFGNFHSPHRVKKITENVISVSVGDQFGACLTAERSLYTWGINDIGQLGTGDYQDFGTPNLLNKITVEGREINKIACGSQFTLCLSQAKEFLDAPVSLAEYHEARAQVIHKGMVSVQEKIKRQEKQRLKELAEAERKANAPKSRINASKHSGASGNPFLQQAFLSHNESFENDKPHFGMSLPTAEELQRTAAVNLRKDEHITMPEKPRMVVQGQRSLSSDSVYDDYVEDPHQQYILPQADNQLEEVDYDPSEDSAIEQKFTQDQANTQKQIQKNPFKTKHASDVRLTNQVSQKSSGKNQKQLTKKSVSQQSQKSMKSQAASLRSNSKIQTSQRSNRSQTKDGSVINILKKSGGPKGQPGQGKANNRPPKSQRADKNNQQNLSISEQYGNNQLNQTPVINQQMSSVQVSHLSMLSKRTNEQLSANEKYVSDSSNQVSLKKPVRADQNKENFNRSNEHISVYQRKSSEFKSPQNPSWMVENNAKDSGAPDSNTQSNCNELATGFKGQHGYHDSSLMQSALSPTLPIPAVASPHHYEAEMMQLRSQLAMLRNEKREADDQAYRETQNAKRLSAELCSMRDQFQDLQEQLLKSNNDKTTISKLEVEEQIATEKVKELQKENSILRNQLKDKDREIAKKIQDMMQKSEQVDSIDQQVKMLQTHIEDQDKANADYQAENANLRRELDNLKVIQEQLKAAKSQIESEKEIRSTAEFDIQKMRTELADLQSQLNKDRNDNERILKDLRYELEINKTALEKKVDEVDELHKKIENQAMEIETKNANIEDFKQQIVQSELKNKRLLEQLNAELQKQAQQSIDNTINVLQQRMLQQGKDPAREQSAIRNGVVSTAQHRLNNLLKQDRPKLTTEIAIQELEEKMRREAENNGQQQQVAVQESFSFNNLENTVRSGGFGLGLNNGSSEPSPAELLTHSLDNNKWKSPQLSAHIQPNQYGFQDRDELLQTQDPNLFPETQAAKEGANNNFTSTMIKQSLADLRQRLQQMKQ